MKIFSVVGIQPTTRSLPALALSYTKIHLHINYHSP